MQQERRLVGLAYVERLTECPYCRIYFAPKRKGQRYCSDSHRQRAYEERRRRAA